MNVRILGSVWVAAALVPMSALAQGQETVQTLCSACHTIGGGRLVGPDLQGVDQKRTEQWLINFVQNSQGLVAAGDSVAVALYAPMHQVHLVHQAIGAFAVD